MKIAAMPLLALLWVGAAPAAPSPYLPVQAPAAAQGAMPPDFTTLVKKVGVSVVNITTVRRAGTGAQAQMAPDDPLFEFFRRFIPEPPGGQREFRGRGLGSGFIVDPAGYILTNAHVVADAEEITVRLSDSKREYKAKVIGSDRRSDIALIKVEAQGLPAAVIGNSEQLQVGEWVAAIGSPFGFTNTITAGIVSAKERALPDESLVPFIQTDVAVNPGNSGGPLLNVRGEVVGINSQIYSRTGGYMGVSFAIPIDVAMDIARQLRATGRVTRGRLGIGIQEVTQELAQSFGMDAPRGALVSAVEPGSPAMRAGVEAGDVILRFGGTVIDEASDLPRLVTATKPGTQAPVELWRDGQRRTVTIEVGELPPDEAAAKPAAGQGEGQSAGRLGIRVSELPPQGREALKVEYGLVVEAVEGAPADTPLRRGDVILAINNRRFKSVEEFNGLLAQAKPESSVALLVQRGEARLYVPVKLRG